MLPDLHALPVIFAGEAESPSDELRTKPQGETLLTHERNSLNIPGKFSLGSERACYHEKVVSSEPRTRSFRVARKEKNRSPDAIYKIGEDAWLSVEGKYGSFPVKICSVGTWDYEEEQWKYQVEQTDGKLYENGKPVYESDLNRAQK